MWNCVCSIAFEKILCCNKQILGHYYAGNVIFWLKKSNRYLMCVEKENSKKLKRFLPTASHFLIYRRFFLKYVNDKKSHIFLFIIFFYSTNDINWHDNLSNVTDHMMYYMVLVMVLSTGLHLKDKFNAIRALYDMIALNHTNIILFT